MYKDKKILSWALYDWANSSFSTTVMAGFFPVFFKNYWSQGVQAIDSTARLGTTISFASLLIALLTPFLGAIADFRGSKKFFLAFFMIIGVLSCFWMATIGPGRWTDAALAYGFGMMAFSASSVFYDSLLPSIGRGTTLDYASSLGFSLGYLGGGVLFLINVIMYLKPEIFGLADGVSAVKVSFLTVGVWWFVFSIPLLKNVPEPQTLFVSRAHKKNIFQLTWESLKSIGKTLAQLYKNKNLFIFICAYWLYIDGVYTVMTMAVDFGISLGLESKHLIAALLVTQFVGFPSALVFGLLTKRWGCRKPILFCILIYSIGVIAATQMSHVLHFYALATMIGLVQGGVQSLSRSLFANMIPEQASGEYFGFFNLVGKFASILGPLVVAIGVQVTKSPHTGIGALIILFVLGGALLLKVQEPRLH